MSLAHLQAECFRQVTWHHLRSLLEQDYHRGLQEVLDLSGEELQTRLADLRALRHLLNKVDLLVRAHVDQYLEQHPEEFERLIEEERNGNAPEQA